MIDTGRRPVAPRTPGAIGRLLAVLGLVLAVVAAPVVAAPAFAAAGDITVADADVDESVGSVAIVVTLEAPFADVTVTLSTADATAVNGSDFTWSAQTVTLTAGPNTFLIPVIDDALDENSQTFSVLISAASGGTIVDDTGLVILRDDDPEPTLSINPASGQLEGDSGTTSIVFDITLSAPSGRFVTVSFATSDGTATAGVDYAATTGTVNFAPGTVSIPVTVDAYGDTTYEIDEQFGIALSSPVAATISSGTGTGTVANDDALPTLTVSDQVTPEFSGASTFTVTRTGATEVPITVDYATADGSATAPADYTSRTGTLTFAPSPASVATQTVSVPIVDDAVAEPGETFTLALSNAVDASAGSPGTTTISDDDSVPTVSLDDVTLAEGDSGSTAFAFTLTLDAPSPRTVQVSYTTEDAGAAAGSDYTAATGIATFAPGAVAQTIVVDVTGDAVHEATQDFLVRLTSAVNATLGTATGTGRIVNDDDAPVLALSPRSAEVTEGDGGGTVLTFTVSRSGASELPATVRYDTRAGTAAAGSDFRGASGVLTLPASLAPSATATFDVTVNGDTSREADETFDVRLSAPAGATLGTGTSVVTIVDDDSAGVGLARSGSTPAVAATLAGALLPLAAGAGIVLVRRRRLAGTPGDEA